MPTKSQLQDDVKFLTDMQYTFGLAAHSLILIAYGKTNLAQQRLPDTKFDMDNVEKAWAAIPKHRKKGDTIKAIERARKAVDLEGWPSWETWSETLKQLFYENKISIEVTETKFHHHFNQMLTPQDVVDAIMNRPANY